MKLVVFLIALAFAAKQNQNVAESENCEANVNENGAEILVKIEEDEYAKISKRETYFGVSYREGRSKWYVQRHNKIEKRLVYNGCYNDEETAAHASDTLARNLMANDKQNLKLNFPDDDTEVYPEKTTLSQYIGVSYSEDISKWLTRRYSKNEKKIIYNGRYKDEETAAHASDTLARKLTANGEQGHKLNFPDDHTRVYPEKKTTSSKYIGVSYSENRSKWIAQRRSKHDEKKMICSGRYENEETAAHASDTLAKKLIANGELGHKLNFPEDDTEVYQERQRKRKRPNREDLGHLKNN